MISQKHEDELQQGEQLSSPVEEKQTAAPSEGRSKQAPTSLRRWMSVLLFILGILLAFAGGLLTGTPWGNTEFNNTTTYMFIEFGGMFLSLFVGAALLRSWWALLIVPVAFAAGNLLRSLHSDAPLMGMVLQSYRPLWHLRWQWLCLV